MKHGTDLPSVFVGLVQHDDERRVVDDTSGLAVRQQVIDFPLREPIHKRDGHIPVKQQALAGIRVGNVGKLMLGNTELSCQNRPVALSLREQNHKIGVIQNVLNLPAGQKVVG